MKNLLYTAFLALALTTQSLAADQAVVTVAKATQSNHTWRFDVTIKHADTGWAHYADGWGVYAPDGTELGYRILAHPHVNEQPFTRSLTLTIPAGITSVTIQANDLVHGLGGKTMTVEVKQ